MSDASDDLTSLVNVFVVEDPLVSLAELTADLRDGVALFALSWWVGAALAGEEESPQIPDMGQIDGTSIRSVQYGSPLEIEIATLPEMVPYVLSGSVILAGLLRSTGGSLRASRTPARPVRVGVSWTKVPTAMCRRIVGVN